MAFPVPLVLHCNCNSGVPRRNTYDTLYSRAQYEHHGRESEETEDDIAGGIEEGDGGQMPPTWPAGF